MKELKKEIAMISLGAVELFGVGDLEPKCTCMGYDVG